MSKFPNRVQVPFMIKSVNQKGDKSLKFRGQRLRNSNSLVGIVKGTVLRGPCGQAEGVGWVWVGGFWKLRMTSGQQPTRKWGSPSKNCKEMNSVNDPKELARGSTVVDNNLTLLIP